MEIFSPVGKGTHDGEEFAIMNVVVSFDIAKGFRGEGNRAPFVILKLGEDGTSGIAGAICFNAERCVVEGNGENGTIDY